MRRNQNGAKSAMRVDVDRLVVPISSPLMPHLRRLVERCWVDPHICEHKERMYATSDRQRKLSDFLKRATGRWLCNMSSTARLTDEDSIDGIDGIG